MNLPATGPVTITLTGDSSFVSLDGATSGALDLVGGATIGFTNLEVNLLDDQRARQAAARPAPRWIFAPASASNRLRALGFNAVSLANNHVTDFGVDGLHSTLRALDAAGVVHTGAGSDLSDARAPVFLGGAARRIAFLAVAASVSDQGRASASQRDIQGRPGANPLVYDADVTVDADTYRTIADSIAALNAGPPPGERELTMFGRRIVKGDRTRVAFTLSPSDEAEILSTIRAARQQAEFVILSLHSHEPSNDADAPADFVRQFAHDAIDAGAQLIVGHGPHRLRGVEIYRGVPIFYSLGNFVYQTATLDFRAADQFDAGVNLYTAAIGAASSHQTAPPQLDQEWWWQGGLVLASEDGGKLISVRFYPVALDRPMGGRGDGLPRLASGPAAHGILDRFFELSKSDGTSLGPATSSDFVDLPISENR